MLQCSAIDVDGCFSVGSLEAFSSEEMDVPASNGTDRSELEVSK